MKKKYMYIYNLQQALFFIQNKLIPTEISISKKTKKVYFKFIRDEKTEQVFSEWVERGKKNKKEN